MIFTSENTGKNKVNITQKSPKIQINPIEILTILQRL